MASGTAPRCTSSDASDPYHIMVAAEAESRSVDNHTTVDVDHSAGGTAKELHMRDSMVAGGNVARKYWYVEQGEYGLNGAVATDPTGRPAGGHRRRLLFGQDALHWTLMAVSTLALIVGLSSATLLGRLYFVHGGSGRWLYSLVQCAGWPVLLPLLVFCYWKYSIRPTPLTPRLALAYLALGCLSAVDNLLYAWGISYLPVSTNSLLSSTQLVFTAIFAYGLVRQKITPYILNSIVIITTGTVLLAVSSDSDRPRNTTHTQYVAGFIVTVVGSAVFALLLPLIELVFTKLVGKANFARVLEVEIAISVVSTVISLIGMWASRELAMGQQEAMHFGLGTVAYVQTLFWSAVGWQLYMVGGAGVIFLASCLFSCCLMTVMIPVLPLLAVAFFNDSFSAVKGLAMALSLWGFISYTYGGYVHSKGETN
ncbi:hypothetical protein GOP47_0000208 [Adiantum capillus-veneris]|uniref:Probable purine permease n=1 Tax=Adiantum capillus-veneris TaxID=13818 RepID=A0A9D4ZQC7_ADICA|nr:hypothetical protein GOP47_0000208 [Adiantum capillus-veneris]